MSEKNSINFIDKNNEKQTLYLSQSARLEIETKKLKEFQKTQNKRVISFQKQLIKKLEDLENDYCNLFIISLFKRRYEIEFIQEVLPLVETLSYKKSIATVKRYIRALRNFLFYLREIDKEIFSITEITKEFMIKFHGDILNGNSFVKELSYEQRCYIYSIVSNLLKLYFENNLEKKFNISSLPYINNSSRKAYSQEFSKVLFGVCLYNIEETIANFDRYERFKNKYKNKEFYSYKNLCFTYLKYKQFKQQFGRLAYLNRVSKSKYKKDLSLMSDDSLLKNSKNGIDVVLFDKEEYIIWFLESEIPTFPYDNKKIGLYQDYFPIAESVSAFFRKYGNEVHERFKKVISYKLPLDYKIYPFFVYVLLTTGLNVDTLFNWKVKDDEFSIGEEKHPLDENFRIIWGLKKKTNSYIMTIVDTKEKNGLWKYLKFLKKILRIEHLRSNDFWTYLSIRDYSTSNFSTYSLKSKSKEFCKNNKVIFCEYDIKYIEHLRLRPTKVASELIKGKSLEDIKNTILQHKNIDTSLSYINSNEYKDVLNNEINKIQEELISEAVKFEGKFSGDKKDLKPAYSNYCDNNSEDNCFNYDYCLLCKQSRVFPEHIPIISKLLTFYNEQIGRIGIDKWIIVYESLYYASIDCLERFINENHLSNLDEINIAKNILNKIGVEIESA